MFFMIDIIIPAYNTFETLNKALYSVAIQINIADLKVCVVNDGSIKNYQEIINK